MATSADDRVTIRTILKDPLVGPIIAVVFFLLTAAGLVFPIMALYARSFGVGNDAAGLFISAFGFARLFGDLIGGSIVDRKGERWTGVAGMLFLAACSLATALAPTFVLATIFWGLAGVGSAVVFASLFSYILKAAQPDRKARVLSFFFGAFNIGVIIGGSLGGVIAENFGLAAPFVTQAVVLFGGIFVYLRFVRKLDVRADAPEVPISEAEVAAAPRPSGRIVRDLLRVPGFTTALVLNLTYLWMVAGIFNTLLPLFARQEFGLSEGAIGAIFSVGVAAEFIVLFPAGALSDSHGRKAVMLPSLFALVVMCVVMGLSPSVAILTIAVALLAFASGFAGVPPAAILSDVVPTEHSGRGVGAFRFCGDVGFFLCPLIAGAASKSLGFPAAFTIIAAAPAVAFVVMLRSPETLVKRSEPPR